MSLFSRKPAIELSPDTAWIVEQVVTRLQTQGLIIVSDMSLDEVREQYSGHGNATNLVVLRPDMLVDDLLAMIAERAEVNKTFER